MKYAHHESIDPGGSHLYGSLGKSKAQRQEAEGLVSGAGGRAGRQCLIGTQLQSGTMTELWRWMVVAAAQYVQVLNATELDT